MNFVKRFCNFDADKKFYFKMASKPTRGRYQLQDAVAAIQQSDSDLSSENDSSDEEYDGTVLQDSNQEDSDELECEDLSSESSSDNESPPLRRRRNLQNNAVVAQSVVSAPVLIGRNGRQWSSIARPMAQTAAANVLTQTEGLTAVGQKCESISKSFHFFFTTDMILLIVRETNRRANKCVHDWNEAHQNEDPKHMWIDTDEVEVAAFIGLLIQAGVQKSASESLEEVWSSKYGRPIFRATMSQTRFKELLRFCRFDNFATRDARLASDKLAPIRDLWEMFQVMLPRVYRPGSDITVDEQLVATRGRCGFRQYIPSKPGKYGIKIFWACDSLTSYPLKGEVYVGRQPGAAANANNVTDLVKRLVKPWQNTGRNVTMDNYFTSCDLAIDLLAVRTTVVGTMRKNRVQIPKELLPNRQRLKMSSIFCFDPQLTLTSYVPKKGKAVILLSSMHHDAAIDVDNANKPEIIMHYNKTKSGVDNLDHLVGFYSCKRKVRRWPMTIFFNILDCASVAAYVTWTAKNPCWNQNNTHKRRLFLRELAEALVADNLQRRYQNPQMMQGQVRLAFKALGFQSLAVQAAAVQTAPGQKRCVLCPRTSDRKTKSRCTTCSLPCCLDHGRVVCENCTDA